MKKPKRIVSVAIDSLSDEGNGLGAFILGGGELPPPNGKADGARRLAEVPFTLPSEQANALLLSKKRGIYRTLLEEVTHPSPQRIAPRCLHFTLCGGCRWQHMEYGAQLSNKQKTIEKLFQDLGKIEPILPCDPPWAYRNKMEFSFSQNAQRERFLGLMIAGSRGKVFNLTECHLVDPWFAACVKAVRQWWGETDLEAYHPLKNTGSLRTLTVREGQRTGDRMVFLTVSGTPEYALKKHQIDSFVAFVKEAVLPVMAGELSVFMRIQQVAKGSPTQFFEMHLDGPDHIREKLQIGEKTLEFTVSPTAFFQPNTRQAEKIYNLALELAEISSNEVVYDLYCGTGILALCAAQKAAEVVGIEIVLEAVLDAEQNGKRNGCDNAQFIGGDVGTVLQRLHEEGRRKPDVVFVDPPRAGLDPKAIGEILKLNPKRIVYVSCNPKTQAGNIPPFLEKGYRIAVIQPIDQFPQTIHCENIVVLTL